MNEVDGVIDFWFNEISPQQWWMKDEKFDQLICDQFLSLHQQAILGELHAWRQTAIGRLAEIIILDQFSRNIYRGKPQSFACDNMALVLTQEAINLGSDKELASNTNYLLFMYMPMMHSESKKIHELAVIYMSQTGLEKNLEFELKHKSIIDRFGRYPHRNEILGRQSTVAELEFLQQPDSSF